MTFISQEDALGRPPPEAGIVLPYGSSPEQVGELRLSSRSGPHPVAVVVHGGCWRSLADRHYMASLAQDLTEHGWATWNLDFRLIDRPGGAFPGIFHDVALGMDHVERMAKEFSLDASRVVTLGHSSGGHLALWLAARPMIPSTSEVGSPDPLRSRAVVSLGGIADLEHFDRMGGGGCEGAVVELLGGLPHEVPDRWAVADPTRLLPLGVPQLFLTGEHDLVVPLGHAQAYAARARHAGDSAVVEAVPDAAHFEVVAPWWGGWSEVRARVLDFVSEAVAAPVAGPLRPAGSTPGR